MKVRFNTDKGIMAWDHCQLCISGLEGVAKFTILYNKQKLIKKLCARCARHLNEFGDNDDFETLKGKR